MRIQDRHFFRMHRTLNSSNPYKTKQPNMRMHTACLPDSGECRGYPQYSITPTAALVGTVDKSVITYLGYKQVDEFAEKIKVIKLRAIQFLAQTY